MAADRDSVDEVVQQWRREKPELDTSGLAVVLRILLLAGDLSDRLKGVLAPFGLAPWEFDVLSALRRAGGPVSAKELCASAQLSSGAMTHRLDRLEERGLVAREASPTDRRSIGVSLTPEGRKLVDAVIGARMEDAMDSIGHLSGKERRELARLLRELGLGLSD